MRGFGFGFDSCWGDTALVKCAFCHKECPTENVLTLDVAGYGKVPYVCDCIDLIPHKPLINAVIKVMHRAMRDLGAWMPKEICARFKHLLTFDDLEPVIIKLLNEYKNDGPYIVWLISFETYLKEIFGVNIKG